MKNATIFVRSLIGLVLIFMSITYFFNLLPNRVNNEDFKAFQVGLISSVYLMPMVKTIELLCGLSYLSGRYVTLSNLVVLPVSINILFYNFFINTDQLALALFVFLGNFFLIYRYWKNYKSLFTA
ncbi:DoxX family protein [Flavobacterium laiguense]|uniref:DoxX family protein n=1 Tax=Flavobacterium laiguense TaxID=2169409 RepID=A0A2U1JYX9_9FLAO|nr:DoxX family protein [Flavobacterium laiguense]PWA10437.1 DoxX family protein [Flavobacterium laiguense]